MGMGSAAVAFWVSIAAVSVAWIVITECAPIPWAPMEFCTGTGKGSGP